MATDISSKETGTDAATASRTLSGPLRIGYIMTWFPKLSETFVFREMLEMEKLGYTVEVLPLRKGDTSIVHENARPFLEKACFLPVISISSLLACLFELLKNPLRFLTILATLVTCNLGSLRYLAASLVYFPKAVLLSRVIRKKKNDHVHAHFASHPAVVAYVVHRLTGIPFSFTAHGSDLHRDQHMLAEKCRLATAVITISDYNRNFIERNIGRSPGNIHVVHCGINTGEFSHFKGRTRKVGQSLNLITVGTLHEVKGISYLVRACQLLDSKGVEFRCRIIGDGPDRGRLEALSRSLGVETKVEFLGSCNESEVRHWMSVSDVLVCPSVMTADGRREGIPVVLMEGMACGLPCVASNLSGIPEIVEDRKNGILSEPGSPESIASALQLIESDERLYREWSENAQETARTRFDLQKNTVRLSRVLGHAARTGEEVK